MYTLIALTLLTVSVSLCEEPPTKAANFRPLAAKIETAQATEKPFIDAVALRNDALIELDGALATKDLERIRIAFKKVHDTLRSMDSLYWRALSMSILMKGSADMELNADETTAQYFGKISQDEHDDAMGVFARIQKMTKDAIPTSEQQKAWDAAYRLLKYDDLNVAIDDGIIYRRLWNGLPRVSQ